MWTSCWATVQEISFIPQRERISKWNLACSSYSCQSTIVCLGNEQGWELWLWWTQKLKVWKNNKNCLYLFGNFRYRIPQTQIFALFDEEWKHSTMFALFLNGCQKKRKNVKDMLLIIKLIINILRCYNYVKKRLATHSSNNDDYRIYSCISRTCV